MQRACTLAVILICVAVASALLGAPAAPPTVADDVEVLMFHGDLARTGWNSAEHTLTPAALRTHAFGRRWTAPVEGEIYAEPLVARNVPVRGAAHTVVYTVTEHDLIYAFDAADGSRVWGPVSLGRPVARENLPCGNIDPAGITSTPVIDRASSTLYVVGLTTPDNGQTKVYKLAAVDLATGAARPGYPAVIAPPVASGLHFDPGVQQQRGALTMLRGVVYIPFGGYLGDCGDYHGWVVGVPAAQPDRQQAFATPTHREGGIWATGGLAADAAGNLYAATGNSDSGERVDLSNSVVRLATAPTLAFSGRAADFFAPSNFVALNATDTDLGSSAPLVLPPQPGTGTPDLVFIAGKQGVGYLINRAAMGGVAHGDGIEGEGVYSRCIFGGCRGGGRATFSASAYWNGGSAGQFILVPGRGNQPAPCHGTGGVVALRLEAAAQGAPAAAADTRSSIFKVAWCSPLMGDAGAPSVSGTGPDGSLVWVVDAGSGVLYALNAADGEVISRTDPGALGVTHRFITPAVANGRVYVGVATMVVAYGLR